MTLRAFPTPPMVFPLAPVSISTPHCPLLTAELPKESVPMKLAWTTLPVDPPKIRIPLPAFPEMMLPAPGAVPPTVLFAAPAKISTPLEPMPTFEKPARFPIWLPHTTLLVVPRSSMTTPSMITLPAAEVVPPTVLPLAPPSMRTPMVFGISLTEVRLPPMRLSVTTSPVAPTPVMRTPAPWNPLIAKPRIVQLEAVI